MAAPTTILSILDLNPRKFGSLEEFCLLLSSDLHERKCRSVLVFSDPAPETVAARFRDSDAVIDVSNPRRFGAYLQLARIIRKYRPKAVHFHFYEHLSMLPVLVRLCGPDLVIFTDHCRQQLQTPGVRRLFTRLQLRIWNWMVPKPLHIRFLAVSGYIKQTLVADFGMDPKTIEVVRNGVNSRRFAPADARRRASLRQEFGVPADAQVVVSASALSWEKGIGDLLVAAKYILAKCPATVFLIAGDGPLGDALAKQAQDQGVERNVRFLGLIDDVSGLMTLADVVAVPSVWQEPAGLVVLEGMSCGRPVVATRVGGIPEYLQDGLSGILVAPRSPEQLASALLRLLESPEEADAMGRAARQVVESRFTMKHWVAGNLTMYEPILAATKMETVTARSGT